MKSALTRVCCFDCSVGFFAQNTHTILARTFENFEYMHSLVFSLALKIRVSMVRFRPRPPIQTLASAMLLGFSYLRFIFEATD